MKISAVIASYNRREALACCLTTLLDQDLPPDQYQIVVVVDGSTDGTIEMLNSFGPRSELVVVKQENQGQTASLNTGVAAAKGEIVLFLDDDLLCDRGLISAHLAAHEHGASVLVIGRMQSVLGSSPSLAEKLMHDNLERSCSRLDKNVLPRCPDDAVAGPNCSMLRSIFLAAGGYDEKLFPRRWEDTDLGLRLWKMGIQFRFEPRAITSHHCVKSVQQFWNDAEEDGASMIKLCRKHPEMRSRSEFANAMTAPALKRNAARAAANVPAISRVLVGSLVAFFEKLSWLPWARRKGLRLFQLGQSVAMLTGAQREVGSWRLLTKLFGQRLAVLLYHHVGVATPKTKSHSLTVSPAKFRRQIQWLRWRGYAAITTAQWLAWCSTGEPIPGKSVLLTFDDAYADIAKHALPVLNRCGFQAAVFVITGQVGARTVWDGLPMMSMNQIQYWAARGMEIGAHTRTHPDLTVISDNVAADEIKGSKEDLMRAGLNPLSFAYPHGCFDDKVRKFVEGNFPLAFTCEEGLIDLRTDPLLLRRTMVQPSDSILDIELRAALGRNPLSAARRYLHLRSRFVKVLRHLRPLLD